MAKRFKLEHLGENAAFPYLGLTVAFNKIDWPSLYRNLRKAQWRWGMMVKVLAKVGVGVWSHVMVYNAVVQTMILYRNYS